MLRPHQVLLCSLTLAGGALVAGCGARGGDALVVYSGQHEQTTARLVAAFEKQAGIRVSVRTGEETALGAEVVQEGTNSPADVFYSENSPVLESLRRHGLLAQVDPSTLAQVPAHYSSPEGSWVGVSARASALAYNTSALAPASLPSSILELAEPRWKGKLAIAPSETDFQPLITAVIRRDGAAAAERWLKGMQANARIYPDNETLLAQVNRGESALGLIDHYYWYRLRAELGAGGTHSALHYFAPGDVGELLDVSAAAVLRSSAHAAAAQRFLAFLVSGRGQSIIATSDSFEYPLRPGVRAATALRPLASLHPVALTPAELGDGAQALALEQKIGLL
jgi:iron(III) transport system substrate-binding protein